MIATVWNKRTWYSRFQKINKHIMLIYFFLSWNQCSNNSDEKQFILTYVIVRPKKSYISEVKKSLFLGKIFFSLKETVLTFLKLLQIKAFVINIVKTDAR